MTKFSKGQNKVQKWVISNIFLSKINPKVLNNKKKSVTIERKMLMTKKQNKETERMQLTVDYAFKRVFGRNGNESILKDFLEAILDIEINSITIQNPEIPKNMKDGKIGLLDIRAEVNGDEITEVEMQVQNQYNINKRSPTYLTKLYSEQLKEGDTYIKVKKVAVINILNFNFYKRNTTFHPAVLSDWKPSHRAV